MQLSDNEIQDINVIAAWLALDDMPHQGKSALIWLFLPAIRCYPISKVRWRWRKI
ncbi:hypothetical protein [Candidatus Pantoea bituminis]|uniref:hypothetical protein n=1 Tax=Candidatus Pantoea bituminis TaxID=2831036 RepID=UPI00208EB889|nr:hypothetical protein [Pantoea bituminis]